MGIFRRNKATKPQEHIECSERMHNNASHINKNWIIGILAIFVIALSAVIFSSDLFEKDNIARIISFTATILSIVLSLLAILYSYLGNIESFENLSEALMQYNQSLIDMVKESTKPLLMINQEVNALTLIASEELREKLKCLKELVTDLNNEMQNCLSVVSAKDSNSFKYFETIGHNKRWVEYQKLYDEIVKLMRKEINVK